MTFTTIQSNYELFKAVVAILIDGGFSAGFVVVRGARSLNCDASRAISRTKNDLLGDLNLLARISVKVQTFTSKRDRNAGVSPTKGRKQASSMQKSEIKARKIQSNNKLICD